MQTSAHEILVPVPGCRVTHPAHPEVVWQVESVESAREGLPWLRLVSGDDQQLASRADEVRCGFAFGQHVRLEDPGSRLLGGAPVMGEIVGMKPIGHQVMVYVQDFTSSAVTSHAYQFLRLEPHPLLDFVQEARVTSLPARQRRAEAMRLRALSYALERWNENTGALSSLEVDPLPHQLQLVNDILESGNLNWMIADDVGLGKTIEVGMLLQALRLRQPNMRVLIVTPSGLTRQWQQELAVKFNMNDFRIYGDDFHIGAAAHWKQHGHVIVSMDRAKHERHLERFRESGQWDLILFDEAHRLTRREYGESYYDSQRYRLAAELRRRTPAMLLLTATPHQGRGDMFRALLELLRPELRLEFDMIAQQPQVLSEMVYRNRKSDVTDADGELLFRAQYTHNVPLRLSEEERQLDQRLQDYFLACAERGREMGGVHGRSIGFVMTVFRKLAASSHAAIHRALSGRLERLQNRRAALHAERNDMERGILPDGTRVDFSALSELQDAEFFGELEESWLQNERAVTFFDGEERELEALIELLEPMVRDDSKLRIFLDQIFAQVTAEDPERKLLVFTEFRSTQEHVVSALRERLGEARVDVIHGGMKLKERLEIVDRFSREGGLQVIVSTEAGGEGINLHHQCATMVNYDLPWNPMRLVQRVGRLYRYGQKEAVTVFNLHSPDTLDGNVLDILHQRLAAVADDLGGWNEDYRDERLHAQIVGELLELLDGDEIERLLRERTTRSVAETEQAIERALVVAGEGFDWQRQMLSYARHFDAEARSYELQLDYGHLDGFIEAMLEQLGAPILERQHGGQVWRIQLNDALREVMGTKAESVRITTRRSLRQRIGKEVRMMDFDDALFKHLLRLARSEQARGHCAEIRLVGEGLEHAALMFARVVWQDRSGRKMREELVSVGIDLRGEVCVNDVAHAAWLRQRPARPLAEGSSLDDAQRMTLAAALSQALDRHTRERASSALSPMFHHPLAVARTR